jgi:hypothetical protein
MTGRSSLLMGKTFDKGTGNLAGAPFAEKGITAGEHKQSLFFIAGKRTRRIERRNISEPGA